MVPGTFVDQSTITVVTPPRKNKNDTAHVSVTNDGATFTSLPGVRKGGAGSYLEFNFVGHAPWGPWDLGVDQTSTSGVTPVLISRTGGKLVDGATEGSDFYASDDLFCAHGVSASRTFSKFTEVEYVTGSKIDTEPDKDSLLTVAPTVGDAYDTHVQRDATYEIVVVNDAGVLKWKWRKWSLGMFPSGVYSGLHAFSTSATELEYGVMITFASATGKSIGDVWRFDALTKSPYATRGVFVDVKRVLCQLPPADPSGVDVDIYTAGSQRELKVSYRGLHSFSDVTYTDATGVKSYTGSPKDLGTDTTDLQFTEDTKLFAHGYFSGPEDLRFEVEMTSASAFKFRAYRVNDSTCKTSTAGAWCAWSAVVTGVTVANSVHLKHGAFVSFATAGGKVAGETWQFDALTFWSTTFSPVVETVAGATGDDDAVMYVEGTFVGTYDETFEVEIMADTGTFRWKAYDASTGDGSSSVWTDAVSVSQSATLLRKGVSVNWLTLGGKTFGDKFTFTAFHGHVTTTLGKSYVSDAVAKSSNAAGDARTPTITGTYLGHEKARLRMQIAGACTTSCSEFKWIFEKAVLPLSPGVEPVYTGGMFSELTTMQSLGQSLAYGIYVTWGLTSGYKVGNEYFVDLFQSPTSVLPATPNDFDFPNDFQATQDLRSTYTDADGDAPTKDAVITIEFTSGTAFKWRLNTGAFSVATTVATDEPFTLARGVNVTFSATSGFTAGSKFLIPLKTHLPRVTSVTTDHGGSKHWPTIARPVAAQTNYANPPNQGSPLSDVVPLKSNTGAHTIHAFPLAGSLSGGGSAVSGSGYANGVGIGLSNVITGTITNGYLAHSYPTAYLKIAGAASNSKVDGTYANDLVVTGTYTGTASWTYQLEPDGTGNTFRWRKFGLGATEAEATVWATGVAIATAGAAAFDEGLVATFVSPTYAVSVPSVTRWTFTANKGHSFQFRDSGRANWSDEVVIDGTTQALSSGVAVRFSQLSGYAPGDQFVIANRTIASYGTFTGVNDATFVVDITHNNDVDPPIFDRATGSTSTGLYAQLTVTGTYAGRSTYVYEVKIVTAVAGVSRFRWRKYLRGFGDGGGPFSASDKSLSLSPVLLDDGVYVTWGAIAGHGVGDKWRVVAHAGDAFKWRADIDGDAWSLVRSVTDVGLVEADSSNVGTEVANVDVRATGEYTGLTDASFAVEVLAGGTSFRWKKGEYLPSPGIDGTENVLFTAADLPNNFGAGTWSPSINMDSETYEMRDGVFVAFVTASGYTAGDLFYVPCKRKGRHALSHGVSIAFGSDSGYSPSDRWSVSANAAIAARGPFSGGTEMHIKGSGFIQSTGLLCRFSDSRTLVTATFPGTFVSANHVACASPRHAMDTVSDPEFSGSGSSDLQTRGVFTGTQSLKFTVSMLSATTFSWRADPVDEVTGSWSGSVTVTPGANQVLEEGVRVVFAAGATFGTGDSWVFTAFSSEYVVGTQADVQLGTIRPGVLKTVSISNDGGVSWSAERNGLTTFLVSDVFVSPSGDDATGDGTSALPYRTIQRGIHASLVPSGTVSGNVNATNADTIVVAPGRYTGAGNTGLFSLGKSVIVKAAGAGSVVIDCAVRVTGTLSFGETLAGSYGHGSVSLVGVNVENCGM